MASKSIKQPSSSVDAKSLDPRGRGFGRSVADLLTLAFLRHLIGGGPSAHNRRGNRRKQSSDRMTRRLHVFESVFVLLLFLCFGSVRSTPQPSSVDYGRESRSRPPAAAAAISSSPFSSDRGDDDGTMVPSSSPPSLIMAALAAAEYYHHGTVGGTTLSSSSSSSALPRFEQVEVLSVTDLCSSSLASSLLQPEHQEQEQAGLYGECLREGLSFLVGNGSASSLAWFSSWVEKQQQQQQKQQPAVPSLNVTVTAAMESHHQHPPGFGQDDGHNGTTTVTSFFFVSAAAASSPFSSDRGDDDGTTTLSFLASISTSSRSRFEAVEVLLGTDLSSSSLALSLFEPEQQQKEHNDAVVPFPVASAKQYHHNISASVSLSWSSSLLQEQQPISTGTIETIKIFVANQYDCLLVYLLGQDFGTVRREIGNWLVDPNGCYAFYRTVTIEPISTVVTNEWDRIVKCVGTVQFFGAVLICIGIFMCIPLDSSPISFHRSSSSSTANADATATVPPPLPAPVFGVAIVVYRIIRFVLFHGTATIEHFCTIPGHPTIDIVRNDIINDCLSSSDCDDDDDDDDDGRRRNIASAAQILDGLWCARPTTATSRSSSTSSLTLAAAGAVDDVDEVVVFRRPTVIDQASNDTSHSFFFIEDSNKEPPSEAPSACTALVVYCHRTTTSRMTKYRVILPDWLDSNSKAPSACTDLVVYCHPTTTSRMTKHRVPAKEPRTVLDVFRQPTVINDGLDFGGSDDEPELDGLNNRRCVSFATNLISNIGTYPRVLPGDKAKAWWTQEEERIFSTNSLIDDKDDDNNFGYTSRTPSLLYQYFPEDSLAYNANDADTNKHANSSKVCPPCDVSQRHYSYSLLSLERDELVADADDFDMVDDADVDDTGLNNDDHDDDHDDGLLVGLGPPASSDDDADEDNAVVETVVHHQTRRTRRLPVPEQGRHTRGVVDDDSVLGSAYVDGRRRSRRCLGLKQLGTIMLERGLRRSARIRALLI